MNYTANKVKGNGRHSWSVVFRHPVRKDPTGKVGIRVRRGLGTTDENEAQRLVDELNVILSDPSFWDLGAKPMALSRFNARIVAAFYDFLEPKVTDYFQIRNEHLPLPGAAEAYPNILFVGTTGAGKTTLLRQLIGSDPKKDRFPSTSPNKTTVSDTEVICAPGKFEAVVTFFEQREIRLHVEDCVMEAILAKMKGLDEDAVAMKLLEHTEQRFRFFYVLGDPTLELDDDEEDDDEELSEDDFRVTPDERNRQVKVIKNFLRQVNQLVSVGTELKEQLLKDLNITAESLGSDDRTAFEELCDEELRQRKDFHSLVDDMIDEMADRFKLLTDGELADDNDQWPVTWRYSTDDRTAFIANVRRLSSNYAPYFGKLLTPLVQGIRVRGPFLPTWSNVVPRLVLIDGQGIGHTVSSSSSLPSHTSEKFDLCDAIVLVDSAKQPMETATMSVIKELEASGHISKLRICFTHLDELKGDNLPTRKSRINHVNASFNQVVAHIRDELGHESATNLDVMLANRSYYLSKLDRVMQDEDKHTLGQLKSLLADLETSFVAERTSEAIPFYDEANMVFAIQSATKRFHDMWQGRFGKLNVSNEPTQHWAKLKALCRRLALNYDDGEYGNLRPVVELRNLLMIHIRIYLNQPLRWVPAHMSEEEKKNAVNRIAREIHSELFKAATQRLWTDQITRWTNAYNLSGRGSSVTRIEYMERIFEQSAPIPGEALTVLSHEYLSCVRQVVKNAITQRGGRFL